MNNEIKIAQKQMKFWTLAAHDQTLTQAQRDQAASRAKMWANQIEKIVAEIKDYKLQGTAK